MSVYISYVYAIRRRWSCLLTHMWRFQKKNITRQKHHKNCKHQTTWIHCANWLTHAHSLFSAQIGGFEFDIPHWLWDERHDPRNYTWLHFQGLVCIDLTIPLFCFSCILSQLTGVVWAWWDTCLRKSKKVSKIPALLRCPCLVGQPGC